MRWWFEEISAKYLLGNMKSWIIRTRLIEMTAELYELRDKTEKHLLRLMEDKLRKA